MLINVDLGNGIIAPMEDHLLDGPFHTVHDDHHEHTVTTEYRFRGKVVHRSVHVTLKEGIGIEAALGRLG